MNKTSIEWTQNPDGSQGYTWNPITGCLNNDNGLCKGGGFPCYAYKLANERLKSRYQDNLNVAPYTYEYFKGGKDSPHHDPFYPRFWEERLEELPIASGIVASRKGIFVCDMGDLFGMGIPEEWTRKVLQYISEDIIDRFYLLTKQPQELIKWSPFPENCWVGVTATNGKMLREVLMHLEEVKAPTKHVSLEPLLDRVYKPQYFLNALPDFLSVIDWLIIGACTGTWRDMVALSAKYPELAVMKWGKRWTAQPRIEWVQEIVEAADKAGIKVFLKDNLRPLLPEEEPFYTFPWGNDPEAGIAELRQEMPE